MLDQSEARDVEVLRLRNGGRAFARISRDLEFDRPHDAQLAFKRALLRLPASEQATVRKEETTRLNGMAARVEADTDRSPEERARRLKTIDRLRQLIAAEH